MRVPFLLVVLIALGCSGPRKPRTSYIDETAPQSLVGWLGASVQPLTGNLTVEHDDESHVPGGVVVRDLAKGEPLDAAGAKVGDVIVRVEDTWMPLKRDMHLELVRLVEQAVSAGQETIALGVWRKGSLKTLTLTSKREPLENGLPVDVARFKQGAQQAIQALSAADSDLATALTELARLANGDAVEDPMDEESRVLTQLPTEFEAESLAWRLLFQAERVGPLPDKYILATRPTKGAAPQSLKPGPAGALKITPEMLKKMMEGGGIKLPAGALPIPVKKPDDAKPVPGKKPQPKPAPGPDAAALIQKFDPERVPHLKHLGDIAHALGTLQAESGGWAKTVDGEPDPETTSVVLWALGCAQRVGASVPAASVEKALAYLHEKLAKGRLSIEVAKGADRRIEAGRAALAAVALRALGCPDDDEMLVALWKFSDKFGREVLQGSANRTAYLIATAVGRRSRGLGTWQTFYDDFRIPLVAAQMPSGAFVSFDAETSELHGSATAAGALVLSLQSERVPVLLLKAENPLAPRWNAEGKPLKGGAKPSAPKMPAGAPDPAAMLEMLKKAGVTSPK